MADRLTFRSLLDKPRKLYTFTCPTCGFTEDYTINLRDDLRGCGSGIGSRSSRRCRGTMVLVAERPDDRGARG